MGETTTTSAIDRIAELEREMREVFAELRHVDDVSTIPPERNAEWSAMWQERRDLLGSLFPGTPDYAESIIEAHRELTAAIEGLHFISIDVDGGLWRAWCTCDWESAESEDGHRVHAHAESHLLDAEAGILTK